jgi:hypothetical protein
MDNLPQNKPKQTASGVRPGFDYDSIPEFADELRAIADRIHPLSVNLTKNMVKMGLHLEAPQGRLTQRQFDHWVKAEWGFTGRSGRNWIAAARFVQANEEIFSQLPITALYALAQASTEVVETVRARLAGGEVLRAHHVKTVIANAKATSAQDAAVPGSEVPPPSDDELAVRQPERSQSAEAMAAPTESTAATIEQTQSEPERAEPPTAQLSPPQQATDFSLEMGMLQLIELWMDVALGSKSITEHAQTIMGLFTDCHLETLADRLTNYMQDTARAPGPAAPEHVTVVRPPPGTADMIKPGVDISSQPAAAEKTQGGQSPTPALRDHKPAEVNHPLNRIWIDWGSTALKKYRTAEAGTKLWFAVQKKADGHARIMYQSDHRHTNARTDSARRGK